MSETTPLIKAALNLRVGVGFDVYGTTPYPIESDILPFALHFAAESISRAFATSLVNPIT